MILFYAEHRLSEYMKLCGENNPKDKKIMTQKL